MFPKLLEEVTVSWKEKPYSSKTQIQGASSLDFEGMEKHDMAPMKPLVAAHLSPRLLAALSRPPALPSKSDCFQSAMTEKAYKALTLRELTLRELNVTSMLSAYQAELFDDMAAVPETSVWDEITTIVDISLRVQRCVVQIVGKCIFMLVLQERVRWLNLKNLSNKEKEDILDIPVIPESIFGFALASMRKRCEAKKKEDDALQLCFPRKEQPMAQHLPGRLSPRQSQEAALPLSAS